MDSNLDVELDVDNLLSFDLNTQLADLDDFHLDVGSDVNLEFDTLASADPLLDVEEEQNLASLDLDKLKGKLNSFACYRILFYYYSYYQRNIFLHLFCLNARL